MTTATLPRLAIAPARSGRLIRLLGDFLAGVMEGREIATRYERLRCMSNTDLERLGLTRQDIPRAAVTGVVVR